MERHETNIDVLMAHNNVKRDKDLAEGLGLSPQQLSARLKGMISIDTLNRVARYFEVSFKDMIR